MMLRRCCLLAVLLSLLLAGPSRTEGNRNADLERIRGEITRLRSRLGEVRQQARTAQQELEEVDLELDIRNNELALAVEMEQRLEAEQNQIREEIAAIAPRIANQKVFLGRRLAALYRMGGLSYVRMFLSIDQRRDPIEAMSMLSYLVSRDARAVTRFQQSRIQLNVRVADLADRQQRLKAMEKVVEERKADVIAAHNQKQKVLATLRTEETGSQQELAHLEDQARRLERLVALLQKQKAGLVVTTDIRSLQGGLIWPVDGKLVETFGRQRNAKFSTVTISNGVKIATAAGTPVRSVFQGTVLYSQWFKGYGNLIILDHGNRIFSLYGNLKAPAVAVGDRIATGQAIAGVGEGEEAQSGFLYFEIRQDNRPEDPQKWLR